jgi:hypothetical protein
VLPHCSRKTMVRTCKDLLGQFIKIMKCYDTRMKWDVLEQVTLSWVGFIYIT